MMSNARHVRLAPRAALLLALAAALAGCSAGATLGQMPEKLGGLPESAPQRPAERMPFPNVYEPRPQRSTKPLNDEEQKKLGSELATLRDQQNQRANPPPPPPPAKKAGAPGKKTPAAPKVAQPVKKKQNEAVVPEQKGPVVAPKLIN
jgi:hypothetical protein